MTELGATWGGACACVGARDRPGDLLDPIRSQAVGSSVGGSGIAKQCDDQSDRPRHGGGCRRLVQIQAKAKSGRLDGFVGREGACAVRERKGRCGDEKQATEPIGRPWAFRGGENGSIIFCQFL